MALEPISFRGIRADRCSTVCAGRRYGRCTKYAGALWIGTHVAPGCFFSKMAG